MNFYRVPAVGMTHGFRRVVGTFCASLIKKNIKIEPSLFGCRYIYDYCSGKAALVVALKALSQLEVSRREVVVPAYTCYSVAAAVEAAGLKMVLCDLVPETLDFNYGGLRSVVNSNTLCIISTHFFCKSADIYQARKIADSVGAYLVEDAAQSGVDPDQGQMLSDITLHSFGRGKPISANGGGILAVNRDDISVAINSLYSRLSDPARVQELKSAFAMMISDVLIQPYIFWLPAKLPFLGIGETIYPEHISVKKMGGFRLLLLQKMIKRVPALRGVRQVNASFYINKLKKCSGISLLPPLGEAYCPIRFPCYVDSGFDLSAKGKLLPGELGISQMYPQGLHKLAQIKQFCLNCSGIFPGADFISSHLIALPTHSLVSARTGSHIVSYLDGNTSD